MFELYRWDHVVLMEKEIRIKVCFESQDGVIIFKSARNANNRHLMTLCRIHCDKLQVCCCL